MPARSKPLAGHLAALAVFAVFALLAADPALLCAQFVEADVEIIHQIHGANAGDNLGSQVCAVADYDGDGAMEFLVGVQGDDTGAVNAGVVRLYDGASGQIIRSHFGTRSNEQLGYVCDAADVDNDGVVDYLYGSADGRVCVHAGADGALIHELVGISNDGYGFRACGIGDVTGDGFGEILVGAWGEDSIGSNAGKVYIHSGADGSLVREHCGPFANAWFGHTVSVLGDLDGDDVPDYSVGAPGPWGQAIRGQIYVYSGATGEEVFPHLDADPTGIAMGGWQQCHGGYRLNGDSVPDFLACDIGDFENGANAGKMYMFDGATGAEIGTIPGFSANSGFGGAPWTPAGLIGDIDGDCVSDLLAASWRSQVGAPEGGQAHVLSGATGAILRTLTSSQANAYLAGTLSGAGDANGDGVMDYILAANGANGNRGAVYVVAGVDAAPTPGDLNRDGHVAFDDLLVLLGAWGQDPTKHAGDVNCDGAIDFADLLILLGNWG